MTATLRGAAWNLPFGHQSSSYGFSPAGESMHFHDERSGSSPRLSHGARESSRTTGLLLKAGAAVAGAVTLVSAFVISFVVFSVGIAAVLVFGGYVWWKSRGLRRQMRSQMQEQMSAEQPRGDVIEGVVISRRQTRVD
jgi:hypothetical protein